MFINLEQEAGMVVAVGWLQSWKMGQARPRQTALTEPKATRDWRAFAAWVTVTENTCPHIPSTNLPMLPSNTR